MSEAGFARRAANVCLQGASDAPALVPRLFCREASVRFAQLPHWQQLLVGRSGWVLVKELSSAVRTLVLICFKGRAYCVDFTPWRHQRDIVFGAADAFNMDELVQSLDALGLVDIAQVYELTVTVVASSGSAPAGAGDGRVRVTIKYARLLSAPLPQRSGRRGRTQQEGHSEDGSSVGLSDSDAEIARVSSASSVASVDTGDDSTTEVALVGGRPKDPKAVAKPSAARAPDEALMLDKAPTEEEMESDEHELEQRFRHPPGAWKIWESTWLYATKTPGWVDMKCWLKWQYRSSSEGMGTRSMSKTLTPYRYGDDWDDPRRNLLLLRAWSIWRARWMGWPSANECRSRELSRQVARFSTDMREAHSEHQLPLVNPLFGNAAAHLFMLQWTPDLVTDLVG